MTAVDFSELSPPYSTIVADPPWFYEGFPPSRWPDENVTGPKNPMPYSSMMVDEIAAMPVRDLAAPDAHLYLWTTNRYLRDAFDIVKSWGFRYSETLVWAKPPKGLIGGAAFTIRTEFVLMARRGSLAASERMDRSWWEWPTGAHSAKPDAFLDLVERVSPGPYVELFCRRPRFGWDSWGKGYEGAA